MALARMADVYARYRCRQVSRNSSLTAAFAKSTFLFRVDWYGREGSFGKFVETYKKAKGGQDTFS